MREQQQEAKSVMQDGKNLVTQAWEVERLQEIIHYIPARQILLYYAKQTTRNFIFLNGQEPLFSAN